MSGPWEDFQGTEDGPWADFTQPADDPFSRIPGVEPGSMGYVKTPKYQRPPAAGNEALYVNSALDTGANLVKGAIGGLYAPIKGLVAGATGQGNAEQVANKTMEEWAPKPSNDISADWTNAIGEVINRYGIPMAGVHIPTAKLPKELRGKMRSEPADVKGKLDEMDRQEPKLEAAAPEAGPWNDYAMPVTREGQAALRPEDLMFKRMAEERAAAERLGKVGPEAQMELPLTSGPEDIAAARTARGAQHDLFNGRPGETLPGEAIGPQVEAMRAQEALKRQTDAQAAIEARQAALERSVAEQADPVRLERLRQERLAEEVAMRRAMEQGPDYYGKWLAEKNAREAAESAAKTRALNERGQQMGIVEDFGNNDPMARMPEMRIDENGIPIRADLSMEVRNLENPLQRNLWGDELPGRTGDGGLPLTRAIDKMEPAARSQAIRDQFMGPSRSQRGAFNPEVFKEGFEKLKKLPNGITLRATSDGAELKIAAVDKLGRTVGWTSMSPENWANPKPTDNLVSNYTGSNQRGMAAEMYRFASELGNDIQPSKVRTEAGKAMWDSFERKGLAQNGMIGRQRGGIDYKAVTDAVVEAFSRIGTKDKFDLPMTGKDAMDRMPALKGAVKDIIPEPPTLEQSKAKILSEKDTPSILANVQSGGINTSQKFRNTLIQDTTRWNLYGQKVADRTIRNEIMPMEREFRNLPKQQLEGVSEVLRREMFAEKRYTPEQLRSAGLSDKAIQAYNAIREQFDKALNKLNEGRAAFGKDPVTAKEAYMASRWAGDWHVPLYDKSGKLVWYIREGSEANAKKAVEWLKKNELGKELDFDRAQVQHRKSAFDPNSPRDVASAYKEFISLLDENDPRTQALKDAMEQSMKDDAYDFMNTKKHFLQKGNTRGFIGDKPWQSTNQNAKELLKSQFQYLKEANRWAETQKAMVRVKEFLADPEIQKAQPNAVAYAHTYLQNSLGLGVNPAIATLESMATKAVGRSRSELYAGMNTLKSMFYLQKLGASVGYMAFTPLQAVLSVANHRMLTTEGFSHNAAKTTLLALSDMATGIARHASGEMFGRDLKVPMSKTGEAALKYAEENGMISHDIFDDNSALGVPKALSAAHGALGWTISAPEKVGRLATFMSFVHHLEASGKFADRAELFQKAEDLTNEVMVDFRRSERPMMFNKAGIAGEAVVPLKSFVFSYYNQLSKFVRMAANGTPTPLVAFLAAQYTIGGLVNMPGMNEGEGMVNLIKKMLLGMGALDSYKAVKDVPGPKEAMVAHLPELAAYGPISKVTGIDFSSRASTGLVNLDNPRMSDLTPVPEMLGDVGKSALDLAVNHDKTSLMQSIWNLGTPSMKGMVEAHADDFKSPGKPRPDGKVQYLKPTDIRSMEAAGPARDESQNFKRSLGLRDLAESRERTINFTNRQNEMRNKDAREQAMDKFFEATMKGDKEKAKEYITMYAQDFEGADQIQSDLNRKLMAMKLPPETRMMLKRAAIANVMAIKRRQEALKGNQ